MQQTSLPTLIFREADDQDGPSILQLITEVLQSYGLDSDPETTDSDLKSIEKHYQEAGGWFEVLVEEKTDNLVGCFACFPKSREICELRKMYLQPDFRGLGLGKEMMNRFFTRFHQSSFSKIELDTALCLKEAIRLYRRFGFVTTDNKSTSARCDLVMEWKPLS